MEELSFDGNVYNGYKLNELNIPSAALYSREINAAERFREEDSPLSFNDLSIKEQESLMSWCTAIDSIKPFNNKRNSYGLKHTYERKTGNYVGNGAFKGAMLLAGFEVKNLNSLNWVFNVSEGYIKRNF